MIKKMFLFLFVSIMVSCGSNKAIVRTTKPEFDKTKPVVKTTKKPIRKTKIEIPNTIERSNKDVATETLEATSNVKVTKQMLLDYIVKYKEVAKENMQSHGVPASIALAQAILESGAGTGRLSRIANNHFGIKCHDDWQGLSIDHDDDELQECFRKYDNVLDSYHDYADFLKGRRWYEPLFELEKNDYKGWAEGLRNAGYATDPKYPAKLIGLIEKYSLQRYDCEVLGIQFVEQPKLNSVQPKVVGQNSHEVIKGDTLFSISKKYNISIETLKKKNNISENSISIGQILEIN